jgi:hypothetical protein
MKPRHGALLILGIELSGCGSRHLRGWSFFDWLGLCLIFLVVALWE